MTVALVTQNDELAQSAPMLYNNYWSGHLMPSCYTGLQSIRPTANSPQ